MKLVKPQYSLLDEVTVVPEHFKVEIEAIIIGAEFFHKTGHWEYLLRSDCGWHCDWYAEEDIVGLIRRADS